MPTVTHERLQAIGQSLLTASGVPDDIAFSVAASLVDSNLKGVDSHGILRLPHYLAGIREGELQAAARPEVRADRRNSMTISGNDGFGIFAMEEASRLLSARAKNSGLAAVSLIECGHTGRVGQFAAQIAEEGLFALIIGGGAHETWNMVAPHGGAKPILGTNPYSMAIPGGPSGEMVVLDFATSAVARGKLLDYAARGKSVPLGWVLDAEGRPSDEPTVLKHGGMQLPMAGHKGFGLGLVAELLTFAMLHTQETPLETFNWLMLALDIGAFTEIDDYHARASQYLEKVRRIPPAEGFDKVLVPGDPERREEAERRRSGIPLPDAVWEALAAEAERYGVALANT